MFSSLALTAALMGLSGGAHCVGMCAPLSQGVLRACQALPASGRRLTVVQWSFQAGRLLAYAGLGALAAFSVDSVAWASSHVKLFKPFWFMLQFAVLLLGLSLLWQGRQPAILQRLAWQVSRWMQQRTSLHAVLHWPAALRAVLSGMLWIFMPCGLLYAAVMVAVLADSPMQGAAVMIAFGLGSAVSMGVLLGSVWPRLRRWVQSRGLEAESLAIRLSGVALTLMAAWSLGHGLWMKVYDAICAM
ncbi:MAG: sulfite exporter TauE/SafE family protein [Burkholderiaceae bacterium]|nr:MAG: sulfite exporter TauE/SafE family protein [Burkholderiaceae bacterium]